jgi:hypothetical protein
MSSDSQRPVSSIPTSSGLIPGVLRVLGFVDELPAGATGVLRLGPHGMILLESRKICWAVAGAMRWRLTDILRSQSVPRLSKAAVEDVCQRAKRSGQPIGEALVASGLVSELGLRIALLKHTSEAIAQLARAGATPEGFTVHARATYDPRFCFSPCELLAMLGALDDPARATAAHLELQSTLVEESTGAAFVRNTAAAGSLVVAVDGACDFPVNDLVQVCNWVSGLFDVARTFDPHACAARVSWGERTALVTWRARELAYVGFCRSRASAARLVSKLGQRAASYGGLDVRSERPGEQSA